MMNPSKSSKSNYVRVKISLPIRVVKIVLMFIPF